MLYSLNDDEKIGALLKEYKDSEERFEKNLIMMHIKSDGHLSLNDVYNMTFKMRNLYIESHNQYIEEQKRDLNSQ